MVTFSASLISIADNEFKIKSLYNNDLILNIALKSKETVQKLKFLDSPKVNRQVPEKNLLIVCRFSFHYETA